MVVFDSGPALGRRAHLLCVAPCSGPGPSLAEQLKSFGDERSDILQEVKTGVCLTLVLSLHCLCLSWQS